MHLKKPYNKQRGNPLKKEREMTKEEIFRLKTPCKNRCLSICENGEGVVINGEKFNNMKEAETYLETIPRFDIFDSNLAQCHEYADAIAENLGITCSAEKEKESYNQINNALVGQNIALKVMLDTAQRELAAAHATIAEIKLSMMNYEKRLRGEK
jgi:hypothetical protein